MYEISPRTYKIAKQYGIEIEPSAKINKKIDVFKDGKYIASIGDSRFKDFHLYLKENGKAYANERARLYYLRHKNASLREQLAKLLLWT
jgi:hypothetical protein